VFFGANRACHADTLNCGIPPSVAVGTSLSAGDLFAEAIASALIVPACTCGTTGGMPQFRVSAWQALFAPKNTPPEVVATLNDALVKALDDQHTRQRLMDLGGVIPDKPDRSPEALQALVEGEVARWTRVIRGTSH